LDVADSLWNTSCHLAAVDWLSWTHLSFGLACLQRMVLMDSLLVCWCSDVNRGAPLYSLLRHLTHNISHLYHCMLRVARWGRWHSLNSLSWIPGNHTGLGVLLRPLLNFYLLHHPGLNLLLNVFIEMLDSLPWLIVPSLQPHSRILPPFPKLILNRLLLMVHVLLSYEFL